MLGVWSLRRVLLAGLSGSMLASMESQLCAVGARPFHVSSPFSAESLSRTLLNHHFACVIVPDLLTLHTGGPQARLAALNTLLFESREAGIPLVMLLCAYPTEGDEAAQLISHALGFSRGACGDPVSVQCILHSGGDVHRICRDALTLGARYLSGERGNTGVFTFESKIAHPLHAPAKDFIP